MAQLLRFDPGGAYLPAGGLDVADVASLNPLLTSLRDQLCVAQTGLVGSAAPESDQVQPTEGAFYQVPERLLGEYQRLRQGSELGRILVVTKTMMAEVDRVVVVASGCEQLGVRALLEACCQPYFNELSRGERGSRPRLYFAGESLDSDALQGLLHLLGAQRGHRATGVEDSWSLVVNSHRHDSIETCIAYQQLVSALEENCGGHEETVRRRLLCVVGSEGRPLEPCPDQPPTVFSVPASMNERFSILSAVGLVPAALLGINVMQLLAGAADLYEHFRVTPASSNIVLQFAAVNHLLEARGLAITRVLHVWTGALQAAGRWYEHLLAMSLGKNLRGATPLTISGTCDYRSRMRQHLQGRSDKIINHVMVEGSRFDTLPNIDKRMDAESTNASLPERLASEQLHAQQALRVAGRPSTNLFFPRVDEYYLGQYFQMMMLATIIEGKLMGVDPYS